MIYKFTSACAKTKLQEIRSFVEATLVTHGIKEPQVGKLVLAIDEVCANLIIHSHQCNENDHFEINIHFEDKKVIFDIVDSSDGFDLRNYKSPILSEVIKHKKKGGLGLFLVSKIIDEIDFVKEKDKCICRLVKRT